MTKKVKDFLEGIKEKKIEQLMGIALDMQYWKMVVGESNEEDNLRAELETENKKRVFNKNGTVFKDSRDTQKVEVLNNRINEITKAKEELQRLQGVQIGITNYLKHVTEPDEKTQKILEDVAKL